jgi:hypothetical protein
LQGRTRKELAVQARTLLVEWGMCTLKTNNPVKFVLLVIEKLTK